MSAVVACRRRPRCSRRRRPPWWRASRRRGSGGVKAMRHRGVSPGRRSSGRRGSGPASIDVSGRRRVVAMSNRSSSTSGGQTSGLSSPRARRSAIVSDHSASATCVRAAAPRVGRPGPRRRCQRARRLRGGQLVQARPVDGDLVAGPERPAEPGRVGEDQLVADGQRRRRPGVPVQPGRRPRRLESRPIGSWPNLKLPAWILRVTAGSSTRPRRRRAGRPLDAVAEASGPHVEAQRVDRRAPWRAPAPAPRRRPRGRGRRGRRPGRRAGRGTSGRRRACRPGRCASSGRSGRSGRGRTPRAPAGGPTRPARPPRARGGRRAAASPRARRGTPRRGTARRSGTPAPSSTRRGRRPGRPCRGGRRRWISSDATFDSRAPGVCRARGDGVGDRAVVERARRPRPTRRGSRDARRRRPGLRRRGGVASTARTSTIG